MVGHHERLPKKLGPQASGGIDLRLLAGIRGACGGRHMACACYLFLSFRLSLPARSWNISRLPCVTRGKTNRVTLIGEELAGATGLWTSLPKDLVSATLVEPSRDDQVTFDVKVAQDAPIGPLRSACWPPEAV